MNVRSSLPTVLDTSGPPCEKDRMTQSPPRVLSGIQPTSDLHLGNYLGAIKGWVTRQAEKENLFCIVDLHAITAPHKPEELRHSSIKLLATYLACGLDPKQCTLFLLGWLNKMTQFKDKSLKQESVGAGLLMYPVLMAADILVYRPDEVPVGEDQKQHVELARNIAERFNHLFGETLSVPQPVIPEIGARIMGLDAPLAKMSKSSAANPGHAVFLTDSPETIRKAFRRAVTDPGSTIAFSDDAEKAGVNNLLSIYKAVTGKSKEAVETECGALKGYGYLKDLVADAVIAELTPIRERYGRFMEDQSSLESIMRQGAEKASAIAEPIVALMKERMGFIRDGSVS
jgi:tryptophanyl-tRNA synthetase